MKGFLMCFLLTVFFSESQTIMNNFHELQSKQDEENFLKEFSANSDVVVQAYVCAVEMKQAEYAINPISKLKIFNKTKKKLALLIKDHPNNIHLRYVRLLLQEKTPAILGYKDNIDEDTRFLKNEIKNNNISKEFQTFIESNTSI